MKQMGCGEYSEATDEKEILKLTTTLPKVIVHFYHKDFKRCKILDYHLQQLAPIYTKTRFLRVNVERAPFLVDRMKIQVLPCVVGFVDGVSVDRIVGFEELGNGDNFATTVLEKRLQKEKVIEPRAGPAKPSIFGFSAAGDGAYDSDDY